LARVGFIKLLKVWYLVAHGSSATAEDSPSRASGKPLKTARRVGNETVTAAPIVIAPKALDRFKQRIREVTSRVKGVSMATTIEELAPYMRGWRSYFGFCETPEVLIGLTRWVRLRLRAAMWRQWKTPRRRRAALLELGVRARLASNTAGSGLGPWYLAKAKALSVGLSNAYFKSLGLPSLFEEALT
jgi:group II intron maturase